MALWKIHRRATLADLWWCGQKIWTFVSTYLPPTSTLSLILYWYHCRKKTLYWSETVHKSSTQEETLPFYLPRLTSASCPGSLSQHGLRLTGQVHPKQIFAFCSCSLTLLLQTLPGMQGQWKVSWFLWFPCVLPFGCFQVLFSKTEPLFWATVLHWDESLPACGKGHIAWINPETGSPVLCLLVLGFCISTLVAQCGFASLDENLREKLQPPVLLKSDVTTSQLPVTICGEGVGGWLWPHMEIWSQMV